MSRPFTTTLALLTLSLLLPVSAVAQQQRPYTEGNVVTASYLRTKPGMFEQYMKYLQGPYKQLLEAEKKAGIVVDYAVLTSAPRGKDDWDVLLTVTFKNMAALDGLDDRTDPIADKVMGPLEQRNRAAIDRGAMREVIGSRLLRELVLK
jgi:hypothetical protein